MDPLKEENVLVTCVPKDMAYIFQLLNLTVNLWAKNIIKEKFSTWYAQKNKEGLDGEIDIIIRMPPAYKIDDQFTQ